MTDTEALTSPSEELDTVSLPKVSVSDPPGTPAEAWLSELDVDGSRWIDSRDEAALSMWGSPAAGQPLPPFDPASAFEDPDSEGVGDSDSNRSDHGWQSKEREGSPQKRQRLEKPLAKEARLPSTSETVMTGREEAEEVMDDEERSSGDFQGPDLDGTDDILKALGPENVRKLASMPSADLQNLGDDSDSDTHSMSEDSSRASSIPDSSEEMSDGPACCVNCTQDLYPGQTICSGCKHDSGEDAILFSTSRLQRQSDRRHSKATMLVYDDRLTDHEEGKQYPHPERPDRIRAVIARLMSTGLADRCMRVPCREATKQELTACHTESLVAKVGAMAEAASISGREIGMDRTYFTADTYVRPSTFRCASLAAGGCVEVATAVARGEVAHGAAIVRPPGHHAESGMAMGFCFFNNAAVAARAAQQAGAGRVLILDWDVHHGNGTQHIFDSDPSVLYMSIHRWDGGYFFPGTGGPNEVGKGPGEGFTVNVPWPCGMMGNGDYLAAFNHVILPIAYQFSPDIIIVSAGFDAAQGDPLGGCKVTPEGYAHMTALLGNVAPLAVLLEGGYNLTSTAMGSEATLRVLLGERPPPLPKAGEVNPFAALAIQKVAKKQAKYWSCLRPFVEHLSFNPYASPFAGTEGESPTSPTSPSRLSPRPGFSSTRKGPPSSEAQLLVQKGGCSLQTSSQDVARALSRTKVAARRQQGKSQRRWQYMHALHLVALRHRLKAAKAISAKLVARGGSLHKLSSDAHTLPSPGMRGTVRTPFEASRPTLLAETAHSKELPALVS